MTCTALTIGTLEPGHIKTGAFQVISVVTKCSVLRHFSAVPDVARSVVIHSPSTSHQPDLTISVPIIRKHGPPCLSGAYPHNPPPTCCGPYPWRSAAIQLQKDTSPHMRGAAFSTKSGAFHLDEKMDIQQQNHFLFHHHLKNVCLI